MAVAIMRAALPLVSSFLLADAIRLGDVDDDEEQAGVSPKKLAKKILKKFGDENEFPESRPVLAAIRQPEMEGGSDGSSRKYQYLGTKCMQQRLTWAAEQFKKAKCGSILEVGGFRTPLPSVVKPEELPGVQLYVDVDPSAEGTKKEDFEGQKFPSVTLQLILDEFRAGKDDSDSEHQGKLFDCFLMLGTTAQNVGDDKSKKALKDAVAKAKLAILEYPSSNTDTPSHFQGSMKDAGMEEKEKKVVDCRSDDDSIQKRDPKCEDTQGGGSCLERNIILYKRAGGDEEKKKKKSSGKGA